MPIQLRIPIFALAATLALCPWQATARPGPDDPLLAVIAGEFALQSGASASAAAWLARAASNSDDPALAERAARVAILAGDPALSRRALDLWRERAGATAPAELLQLEAGLALAGDDIGIAVATLLDLVAAPGGWQLALQALAGHDEASEAAQAAEAMLAADALPAEEDAWLAFGGLARRLGDEGLGDRLAAGASERFPDSPRVWLWRAERLRVSGDAESARDAVERAVGLDPDGVQVLLGAASELDAQGDAAAAAALLDGRLDAPALVFGRLAYLARAGDDSGLAALYDELEAAPGAAADARPYLLGQLAELLERPADGLRWYAQVTDPARRPQAELRQAVLLEQLDRLEEAVERLRTLQASDDGDAAQVRDAYLLEGELLLRRDHPERALAAYDRGLAIFDDEPQLLYARALLQAEQRDVDGAERDLRRLIALDPEDANALNALGYTLADLTDRHEEALGLIERALALEPDSPAIIDSMGWVLYRMGRPGDALAHLEKAFALQPDAEIAAHLGEVLHELGQVERAREVWDRGREVDADNAVLRRTMERYAP